jgi:tetratricopeptide (TPR) repeat protein
MTGRKDIFEKAMKDGHSAAWDQSWEKAAEFYRRALEEFPEHPSALSNLGLALFELQEQDESLRCYIKLARLTPDDALPMEKISQLYEQIGIPDRARAASLQAAELYLKSRDVNKAIENWQRVTQLQPENLTAHSRLAQVYDRLGKIEEAVAEYLALAAIFQRARDMDKSIKAIQRALQIQPDSGPAASALSTLRDRKQLSLPGQGRPAAPKRGKASRRQEAVLSTEQVDPITGAHQNALSTLAALLFETPDDEPGSRRGFQSMVRGTGNLRNRKVDYTRIMLHLGQVVEMETQGNLPQAEIELERAVEAGLENAAAYFDLGYMYMKDQNLENATRNLQVAVQHNDYVMAARLLLGQIFKSKGQLRQASVEYLQALRHADAASVSAEQADALLQLYEPLVEAQSLEPDTKMQAQVCENISSLLMRPDWRDHIAQARQQLPNQADGGPPIPLAEILTQARSSMVVESLSTIYQLDRAGYARSAMEEAFFALQYAPTYLPLHVMMGELLIKQGQNEEAMKKFLAVAESYSTRGEARRAIGLFRRVIELAPVELDPRMQLINLLTSMGQYEEALNEYIDFAEVYYSLADLENARKTYVEALQLTQQFKTDRSWQVRILHRMADIYQQSMDWKSAVRAFEQIRTVQPDDEKARSNLIELNFRLGQEARALAELDNYLGLLDGYKQQAKGMKFLQGLVDENPKRVGLLRRLAERYFRAGRTSEAISLLDVAGDTLIQAGDINGAIQVIEMILALRPANASEYQALLVQLKSGT